MASTQSSQPEIEGSPVAPKSVHVIVVLDKSGSMEQISDRVVSGFNEFLQNQRKVVDDTKLTLITFSHDVTKVIEHQPLQEVKSLTVNDYKCDGMTALYDAISTALIDYKDGKDTLVLVITDGFENASMKSDAGSVRELVTQREKEGWKFIYLCNSLETAYQGSELGMNPAQAGAAYATTQNLCSNSAQFGTILAREVSAATQSFRRGAAVPNLEHLSSGARAVSMGPLAGPSMGSQPPAYQSARQFSMSPFSASQSFQSPIGGTSTPSLTPSSISSSSSPSSTSSSVRSTWIPSWDPSNHHC